MTKEDLEFILRTHRWRFRHAHFYKHYFYYIPVMVLFALVLPGVVSALLILLFMTLTVSRFRKHYTFRNIANQCSRQENAERIISAFKALSHRVIESEESHIRIKTAISPSSWGEYITAIPLERKILINSWPVQPPVFRKNLENLKVIEEYISRQEEEA
ncbi:MAG: hypothetical protein WD266_13215 [Balneolales bacterium]